MKKLLLTTMAITSISTGNGSTPIKTDLSGTYIGGKFMYSMGVHKKASSVSLRHDGLQGFEKGGYIKFQKDFQDIVLGLENSFSYSNVEGKRTYRFNYIKVGEKIKKKNDISICLNIGKKFNYPLIYGKIGFDRSKFAFRSYHDKFNKRLKGFIIGIGCELPLSDKWYVGGEYNHIFFEKVSFSDKDIHSNPKYRINMSNFTGKLSYKI